MRSKAQGPFATLLLLIPLLAIPLLAVFGIPQFAPVVASPTGSPHANDHEQGVGQSNRYAADDLFAPYATSPAPQSSSSPQDPFAPATASARPIPPARDLTAWPAEPTAAANAPAAPAQTISVAQTRIEPARRESRNRLSSVMGTERKGLALAAERRTTRPPIQKQEAPLTWQAAVARLNALEIHHFRLEPGTRPDRFVFVCTYATPHTPQITRRFEAEASDPLAAVEQVLQQVEAWRLNSRG